ncbi:MAG: transporter substrate-binding domain-containing protein [Rhodoplanes sp.]|uniref:transporter substrate-binding domain-containing protein n=1 Tax=Rhodoplanes sp. TaxID=1968906 RepID=UPI0017D7CDAC|nr:transporter substrate-binding domain-containing protein [Rhodoplanes sp.]NVO14271.1 transporter substrate-binding domain-containing protein [Rhodoplanes sp.]
MPMPDRIVTSAAAEDIPISPAVLEELAPTRRLRVAVPISLTPSAVYAVRDYPTGPLRGVTVALAEALAAATGLPLDLVAFRGTGEIQMTAESGRWDVAFLPADEERRALVDFGSAYHILQSTYLVPVGSRIKCVADADAPGVRITAVRDSATLRASMRAAPRATHLAVDSPDDAVAMMHGGNADAIAMGRESLLGMAPEIAGSRILDEYFLTTTTAVAVPKGRPRARALVAAFVEEAKASGLVRRVFDRFGLVSALVAPPGAAP